MVSTVLSRTPARQAKSHSTKFLVSALSLASGTVIHGITGQGLKWVAVVILVLVLVIVVPAIWSRKGYRRKAALDLIDCLLPRALVDHSRGDAPPARQGRRGIRNLSAATRAATNARTCDGPPGRSRRGRHRSASRSPSCPTSVHRLEPDREAPCGAHSRTR